jgi:hypothetical protein
MPNNMVDYISWSIIVAYMKAIKPMTQRGSIHRYNYIENDVLLENCNLNINVDNKFSAHDAFLE